MERCDECAFPLPEHARACSRHPEPLPPGEPGRDCFQCAGHLMLANADNDDVRVCHGKIRDERGEYEHAWVEVPGEATYDDGTTGTITVAIDNTQPDPNARALPADWYYEQMHITEVKRYTLMQLAEHALRHGHDGPWPD